MEARELYEEWTSGDRSGVRPARVQQLRPDLYRVTGEPIPHRRREIETWLSRKKGHITRLLREAVEEEGDSFEGEDSH